MGIFETFWPDEKMTFEEANDKNLCVIVDFVKNENDIIYLRIENTEKQFPSNYETALNIAKSWVGGNKELRDAKGFVVSFYGTKSTGFVLNFEDLKDEDKIKQVVEELKSAGKQKKECVGIFSGLLERVS